MKTTDKTLTAIEATALVLHHGQFAGHAKMLERVDGILGDGQTQSASVVIDAAVREAIARGWMLRSDGLLRVSEAGKQVVEASKRPFVRGRQTGEYHARSFFQRSAA